MSTLLKYTQYASHQAASGEQPRSGPPIPESKAWVQGPIQQMILQVELLAVKLRHGS